MRVRDLPVCAHWAYPIRLKDPHFCRSAHSFPKRARTREGRSPSHPFIAHPRVQPMPFLAPFQRTSVKSALMKASAEGTAHLAPFPEKSPHNALLFCDVTERIKTCQRFIFYLQNYSTGRHASHNQAYSTQSYTNVWLASLVLLLLKKVNYWYNVRQPTFINCLQLVEMYYASTVAGQLPVSAPASQFSQPLAPTTLANACLASVDCYPASIINCYCNCKQLIYPA